VYRLAELSRPASEAETVVVGVSEVNTSAGLLSVDLKA